MIGNLSSLMQNSFLFECRAQWVAFYTIVIREVRRFLKVWPQSLLPPAITMTMYFLIFGSVIGSYIGVMDGFSYVEYVLPGLVMMSVITNSFGNVAFSFFSSKFQRNIEELLVSPVTSGVILAGYVTGGVLRGLFTGAIVLLVGWLFVDFYVANVFTSLLVLMMTATVFSMVGFINAIYAQRFDDISMIPTFILTPLTYLGGVFYSIEALPKFWQQVSMLNPIWHQVSAFRYGILGLEGDVDISIAFLVMASVIFGLAICCLYLLKKGKGLRS